MQNISVRLQGHCAIRNTLRTRSVRRLCARWGSVTNELEPDKFIGNWRSPGRRKFWQKLPCPMDELVTVNLGSDSSSA
jgi:hypothetical protein